MSKILACLVVGIVTGALGPREAAMGYSYVSERHQYSRDEGGTVVYSYCATRVVEREVADWGDEGYVGRIPEVESDLADSNLSEPYVGADGDDEYGVEAVPSEEIPSYPIRQEPVYSEPPVYSYDEGYPAAYSYGYSPYYLGFGYGYYPYFARPWGGRWGYWHGYRPYYRHWRYHGPYHGYRYGDHLGRGPRHPEYRPRAEGWSGRGYGRGYDRSGHGGSVSPGSRGGGGRSFDRGPGPRSGGSGMRYGGGGRAGGGMHGGGGRGRR